MDDGGSGVGGGGESAAAARVKPSFVRLGDRQIFTVELRPGETTFVSWRKLVKDANRVNCSRADNDTANVGSIGPPSMALAGHLNTVPPLTHPTLESRIAPGQSGDKELEEAPPTNRFSAVIEKIERLYMGKDSDEEDLKDIPDDDQYDTEDSFIDDAELDEYFEVDNSAIKHDGFFVNRGKLERIIETPVVANVQPKKRRRKDAVKSSVPDEARLLNKNARSGKQAALKAAPGNTDSGPILIASNEHCNDLKVRHPSNSASGYLKRKAAEESRDYDKTKNVPVKNPLIRPKDTSGTSDVSNQKCQDRTIYASSKSQSPKPGSEVDVPLRTKEKNGVRELPDLNSYPDSRASSLVSKPTPSQRRDGSNNRPKSSMLERSIKELEKMVAESRPPTAASTETEASSQAIKRRLPREIKQKLAKVARLAGRDGRISKELINRLMSILGHLIQVRTLKRNLKDMISMGMKAKEEKDDRFQQIKKEIVDMIKTNGQSAGSKGFDHQAGVSDGIHHHGSEEKGSLKHKFSMDYSLEDKICDLYDIFVDGLDEDAGPQVRKLYVELAGLWPMGLMDNVGIKRAICRAKERRRGMTSRVKDDDKIQRKKATSRMDENLAAQIAQSQYSVDRLSSGGINASSERPKQEKTRPGEETKVRSDSPLPKKKVKRKAEQDLDEQYLRPEKMHSQTSEERHRSPKHKLSHPSDALADIKS